jgi:hypothetical protein
MFYVFIPISGISLADDIWSGLLRRGNDAVNNNYYFINASNTFIFKY